MIALSFSLLARDVEINMLFSPFSELMTGSLPVTDFILSEISFENSSRELCSAVMVNSEMLFPQTVMSLAITCGSSKVVPEVKSFFMNDALPVPER